MQVPGEDDPGDGHHGGAGGGDEEGAGGDGQDCHGDNGHGNNSHGDDGHGWGKALDENLNILPLTKNGNSIYFPVLIFSLLNFLPLTAK